MFEKVIKIVTFRCAKYVLVAIASRGSHVSLEDSIVIVHGGPGAEMNSVPPSLEPLANKYVLVFYDQRGGGRSELPADTSKLQAHYFVEDLEAVRKHFGLKKKLPIARGEVTNSLGTNRNIS